MFTWTRGLVVAILDCAYVRLDKSNVGTSTELILPKWAGRPRYGAYSFSCFLYFADRVMVGPAEGPWAGRLTCIGTLPMGAGR